MFMRAVGQATITFDPHFASSQITPLFFYLGLSSLADWYSTEGPNQQQV